MMWHGGDVFETINRAFGGKTGRKRGEGKEGVGESGREGEERERRMERNEAKQRENTREWVRVGG